MQKLTVFFLAILSFLVPGTSFADFIKNPDAILPSIISRADWGADESWMSRSNPIWGDAFTSTAALVTPPTRTDLLAQELVRLDPQIQTPARVVRYEDRERLVWAQAYSSEIRNIVIHHTEQDMSVFADEKEAIRSIYHHHTLTRGWGDIGYNYLIGPSGTIYEGRRGGEGVIGAHVRWNNAGSVGVALLGSFTHDQPSPRQEAALIQLLSILTVRYGIDPHGEVTTYQECGIREDCLFHIQKIPTISGHRDIGVTSCPGDAFAPELPRIRDMVALASSGTTMQESSTVTGYGGYIKNGVLPLVDTKLTREPYIRVKLSYTGSLAQILSVSGSMVVRMQGQKILRLTPGESIKIERTGSGYSVEYRDKRVVTMHLTLSSRVLKIDSWDRRPSWDMSGRYRDNLFRTSLEFPQIRGADLIIVNRLRIEDYIRGVAEYTNESPKEHIRALSIAARSYAYSYLGSSRKYPGMPYDASDDPDTFQKYIGYSYELRSLPVQKIIRGTKGMVLSSIDDGVSFRPWYSSSAGGQTRSFLQYCLDTGGKNCRSNPHLLSVIDPVSEGKARSGHGVGLTGDGSAYLAGLGWSAEEILAYYYRDIEMKKQW